MPKYQKNKNNKMNAERLKSPKMLCLTKTLVVFPFKGGKKKEKFIKKGGE